MKPATVVAAFAGLASAFSFDDLAERGAEKAVAGIENMERLLRRQNTATTATATTTSGKTSTSSQSTTARATLSGSNRASQSGSGQDTETEDTNTGTSGNSTAFNLGDPAGGVSMVTPNPRSGAEYYKVGDWVTFAWNFTGVQGTPTAINVLVTNKAAQNVFTIAANASYNQVQTVLWDTSKYDGSVVGQPVLLTDKYTLVIENANEKVATAPAQPGYFAANSAFQFAMYTPQTYTPWNQFSCPTCSGAMTAAERQQWGFLFGMAAITVMSFTWFATGRFNVL